MTATMTAPATSAPSQACALALSLQDMLEAEFEHLKVQDLDAFDARQEGKNALLHELTQLAGITGPDSADALGPEWDEFKAKMAHCRDLHRRNEVLIHRKIDAIRGALQSMQIDDPASSVEIYDRLGKVARRQRAGRGYTDV
jgi:flagellar biosynthesis/type III secretory pathway chaperone